MLVPGGVVEGVVEEDEKTGFGEEALFHEVVTLHPERYLLQ